MARRVWFVALLLAASCSGPSESFDVDRKVVYQFAARLSVDPDDVPDMADETIAELTVRLDSEGIFTSNALAGVADRHARVDPRDYGEPHRRGDDARLDELWDGCANHDSRLCLELYLASPFGSEYEAFARTCGDRVNSGDPCP